MRRLAGYVFDAYDDVDGRILRTVITTPADVPDFVKTAARLSGDDISELADDQFALVMIDEGRKLKKYATVDRGNTALSVMYLLKQAHLLPSAAVKVAASNLVAACIQHGLDVPEQLKLAAKTGISTVSGKSQKPYAQSASPMQILFSEKMDEKKVSTTNPTLGRHDAANADVAERTNMSGTQGTNHLEGQVFGDKEKVKTAAPAGVQVLEKQKSWRQVPYVDMSGWDPAAAQAFENKPAEMNLLDGNYAVDGYDQVKTASAYFEENWRGLEPRKRHDYCVALVDRMTKLGMAIPDDVARYGSTTYAADCDSYVEARRGYIHDEFKPALDTLLEKRAQVSPGTFAEALADFDDMSGLRWHWDAKVADPWMSTFGPSFEKLAEEEWSWDEGGQRCDLAELKQLALNGQIELTKQFGAQFASEFSKNPKSVFSSMPTPNKKVLARMAAQIGEGI